MAKGDIGLVEEVLGWDPRGDADEYDAFEKAQAAFLRIKKELNSLRKENKRMQAAITHLQNGCPNTQV